MKTPVSLFCGANVNNLSAGALAPGIHLFCVFFFISLCRLFVCFLLLQVARWVYGKCIVFIVSWYIYF